MPARTEPGIPALPPSIVYFRRIGLAVFIGSLCVMALLMLTGCASDPYPNDRSMARMSAAQLTWELTK